MSTLHKGRIMSRNSVGRDYSFILFGTVASESCKANSNYLLTHRCEPETKEAHLPLPLLAQESRFIPGSRRCKLESKPVSFADFLSCPCFQLAHNNTALHASPIHYAWKTNVYMYVWVQMARIGFLKQTQLLTCTIILSDVT